MSFSAWFTLEGWSPRCGKTCGHSCWVITSLECPRLRGKRWVVGISALPQRLSLLNYSSLTPRLFTAGGWTSAGELPADHERVAGLRGHSPPAREGATCSSAGKVLLRGQYRQLWSEDDPSWFYCEQWGKAGERIIHTETCQIWHQLDHRKELLINSREAVVQKV